MKKSISLSIGLKWGFFFIICIFASAGYTQNSKKTPTLPISLLEGLAPPAKRSAFPRNAVWRGEWRGDKDYNNQFLFIFEVHLQELENNKIEGAFYWELSKMPFPPEPPYSLSDIGKKATEFVRGSYDPLAKTMILNGSKKDDPDTIIGLARYKLTFSKDFGEFNGVTLNLAYQTNVETDGAIWTKKAEVYAFENVVFKSASDEMLPESYPELDKAAKWLKDNPTIRIYLNGHTDRGNSDESKNNQLSLQRAQAVTNYLISKGINSDRITPRGFGNTRPIESNETEEGRKRNRRVEVEIRTD